MEAPSTFTLDGKSRQSTTRHRSFYSSPAWRRLSAYILRRDPICRLCGDKPSRQADHIVALTDGGKPYDETNIQGVCLACHRVKTSREVRGRL